MQVNDLAIWGKAVQTGMSQCQGLSGQGVCWSDQGQQEDRAVGTKSQKDELQDMKTVRHSGPDQIGLVSYSEDFGFCSQRTGELPKRLGAEEWPDLT